MRPTAICIHKQTMHKTQTYPTDWELADFPQPLHDKSEYDDKPASGKRLLLKKENVNIQLYFQKRYSHKCIIHLVHKINKLCLILTFTSFHFLMIKVRSCKVSVKFSTGSFLRLVPPASALNELDVWNFSRGIFHFTHISLTCSSFIIAVGVEESSSPRYNCVIGVVGLCLITGWEHNIGT